MHTSAATKRWRHFADRYLSVVCHYILDIVPNHAGYWHPWFQTARADARAAGSRILYIQPSPRPICVLVGVWTLPKLNYRSAELRQRIYAGEQAVFRRWLRQPFSADGWRIDVANMLGRQGKRRWAKRWRAASARRLRRPLRQVYLMGENFFDASPQLQGDQWDGVMNYAGFKRPLLYWLRGYDQGAFGLEQKIHSPVPWPTAALAATWRERLAAVPWVVALQQYNLLDSHDTERVRSILGENDALHRLAVLLLLTFPGVPGLYYGDEIGMLDDPELKSRGCMCGGAVLGSKFVNVSQGLDRSPAEFSGIAKRWFSDFSQRSRFGGLPERKPGRKVPGGCPTQRYIAPSGSTAGGARRDTGRDAFRRAVLRDRARCRGWYTTNARACQGGTLWEQI